MPNSENNKRIAKNTAMLYIRMLLTMAVSLYTSRIVLNTLGVEDFGIYNVVGGFVTMFGFLNSAMASATQRFLSFEIGRKDYVQLRNVFSMSVNIHFIIAFVILIFAETVGLMVCKHPINHSSRTDDCRQVGLSVFNPGFSGKYGERTIQCHYYCARTHECICLGKYY